MLKGGCHCGAVRYQIGGKLLLFANCHCPDCRRFSGSAFAAILITEEDGFVVTGAEHLVPYASSPGKQRCFCKTCGCHLFSRAEHRPGKVFVRAGSLDDDPGIKPQSHIWTSMKAPWHDICDGVVQHPEWPPAR